MLRSWPVLASFVLWPPSVRCQNTSEDVPNDVIFVLGSATPQQQWVGNVMQLYQPGAINPATSSCTGYFCGPTNAISIGQSGQANPPGVWGHDEGPSVQLLYPRTDKRLLLFWGDSVTAYGVGMPQPFAYQVKTCDGGPLPFDGTCLGVDTVSILSASDVGNFSECTYLPDLVSYLTSLSPVAPSYAGGTGPGGTCPTLTYIIDGNHNGTSIPWAGFTYEHTAGLLPGEDMLTGHVATGAFPVEYVPNSDTDLFVVYIVQTQEAPVGLNYQGESVLLYENDANALSTSINPNPIGPASMPNLTRAYSLSTLPTGTAVTVPATHTVISCTGAPFVPAWEASTGLWQGIAFRGTADVYPVSTVAMGGGSLTVSTGSGSLPGSPGSTCLPASNTLNFTVVPTPGTGPGRFMFAAPVVLTSTFVGQQGLEGGLPNALRNEDVVCFWGADFQYRASNVYLGCMPADRTSIESATNSSGTGVSAMYYLSGFDANGNTAWTLGDETHSIPLLTSWNHKPPNTACVGELSVRFVTPLKRFLMTYGSAECGGLQYRTSAAPWGPWSTESNFFPNDPKQGWMQRLVYYATPENPYNFDQQPPVFLTDPSSLLTINTESQHKPPYWSVGNPYGPFQYPGTTAADNMDGTVNVFMNLSAFNNYVTWQMTARFIKPAAVRFSGRVAVSPGLSVVP